jgi:hypothetical protein
MPAAPVLMQRLAAARQWRYTASLRCQSEPAAWAALAFASSGHLEDARHPADWLASIQQDSGAVGISADDPEPRWPTSLALLGWCTIQRLAGTRNYDASIQAAVVWSLAERGRTAPRSVHIGHDTELAGWSWAGDTHSWLEPTCMFVLALRAAGLARHPRVREGVRLIVDRLLPEGGANYGNTIVLGQPLVAHVQPTGLAMLALAGEPISDPRVARSLDFLQRSLHARTSPASLAFAVMGLAAHGRRLPQSEDFVASSLASLSERAANEYQLALLLLASQPPSVWLPPPAHP